MCTYLAVACNSNSHARGLHYLTFVCETKKRKLKMYQKSSALSILFEMRRSPFGIEFTTLPPKNHNLFVKLGMKRELEKKELRPQANNAQYNTQGVGREESWRGGGRAAPLHKLYLRRSESEGQQKPDDVSLKQSDYK
jgi:hypothetical protein